MTKYQALAVVIFVLFILPIIVMGYTIMVTGSGFTADQVFVASMFSIVGLTVIGLMGGEGLLKGGDK